MFKKRIKITQEAFDKALDSAFRLGFIRGCIAERSTQYRKLLEAEGTLSLLEKEVLIILRTRGVE